MTQPDSASARGSTRRAGRRKVNVLEAACRVIARRGADATRFADVAQESRVPVSTLQYYFGSREDLLVAAFRHASRIEIASLRAELAGLKDPWERLTRIVARALAGYEASSAGAGRLWIESWHVGIRDAEMRADTLHDYGAWRGLVAEAVQLGIDNGRFSAPCTPERIAVLTIALLDGVGVPLALGDPRVTEHGTINDVLWALGQMLRPQTTQPVASNHPQQPADAPG